MKAKIIGFMVFVCFAVMSCGTLGVNLGEIFTPSQSNSSTGSQSGTSLSSTRNDPSKRGDSDAANLGYCYS
jgi:hypothetical protein